MDDIRKTTLTDADLRAVLAYARVPAYRVAQRLSIHPSALSHYLHGRRQFDQALAKRILEAIELEQHEGQTINQ